MKRARRERWAADSPVPFCDWPGTVHEVAGRRIKAIRARHGYALWLLDGEGRPALPLPAGRDKSLRACLAEAAAFLDKLDLHSKIRV